MKRSLINKTILITGANSGLGWALLNQLVNYVYKIIVIDKQLDKVEALSLKFNDKIEHHQVDLSSIVQVKCFLDLMKHSEVDILIHNAGITHINTFENTDLVHFEKVMTVNFTAPVYLTKHFISRGLEGVICINSIAGFAPLYGRTAYVSSKHALNGFIKTLETETTIECLNVYPSFINTGIRTNAQSEGKKGFVQKNKDFLEPEEVASEIITSWLNKKRNLWIGKSSKSAFWLNTLFPSWYNKIMLKRNKKLWER